MIKPGKFEGQFKRLAESKMNRSRRAPPAKRQKSWCCRDFGKPVGRVRSKSIGEAITMPSGEEGVAPAPRRSGRGMMPGSEEQDQGQDRGRDHRRRGAARTRASVNTSGARLHPEETAGEIAAGPQRPELRRAEDRLPRLHRTPSMERNGPGACPDVSPTPSFVFGYPVARLAADRRCGIVTGSL